MLKLKFSRKGCKAFFKKHPQAKKLAQTKITTAITKEVQTGMTMPLNRKLMDFPAMKCD